MEYLAHISEDKQRVQTVKEHLMGTSKLAKAFAEEFGFGEWGYCSGLLHDVGKYSQKFQRRIRGSTEKTDHATAGAQLCKELGGWYSLLGYCIAGHHSGLPNTGESPDTPDSGTYVGRMKKKVETYEAYGDEIRIPELTQGFFTVDGKHDSTFTMSFLIRMLYSCLVDADYLDTEQFMTEGSTQRIPVASMDALYQKLTSYISKWMQETRVDTVNGRRTEILQNCLNMGKTEKGLFRLTVPTGGGKTVASLAFALQHAVQHKLKHIIYVIPYTSIIEQNARVFSEILGREHVLEHHSNMDYDSSEELKPMQLAAENWDKAVIVTTNVQFFESLFSNRPGKCRKLHNIANSVIIFDEAQMLPNSYLKPCVAAMEELLQRYSSSIVLCTATQPSLKQLFSEKLVCRELCPRMEEQFRFFRRNIIKNMGRLEEQELAGYLSEEHQALCILNTKKCVQRIFKRLKGEGIYHLSTLMYPQHRKRILDKIRICLKNGERCILVATSLVEAGVDLDFQNVYRQVAGVDSIIQAAGRCNRERVRPVEKSSTFIFQISDSEKVPGQEQQIDTARQILRKYEDISSLAAVQEYFERLYGFQGEGLDKKKILEQFKKGRFPFAKIGKEFKLIEENTRTVLIIVEERAREIAEELKQKGATKALMREAAHYCVNIYENVFQRLYGAGMLLEVSEDLKEDFFMLRNAEDYSEKTGLRVDAELGSGIWF